MRHLPQFLCLPLALLLTAGGAPKQKHDAEEQDATDEESDEKGDESEGQGDKVTPGQVHTVSPGDTLWDLSQQYLGSPWHWPKVWSYNPEIANPHWIYPGNKVRFFPGSEEAPALEGEEPTAMTETPSPDAISVPDEEGRIQVMGKIGFHPGKSARIAPHGFVSQKEVEEAAVITGSPRESLMLSYPDTVYLKLRNQGSIKLGDRYVIFRTAGAVQHPVTQKKFGYLTHVIGTVRVVEVAKDQVTAEINPDTWDEVHRGDMVGPSGERLIASVAARKNERELRGFVIGTLFPFLTLQAEHSLIVVDKGSADGVLTGNTFDVIRQQDPTSNVQAFIYPAKGQDFRLPKETVGSCIAVEVKEQASLCLLTRTTRDIFYGDRVWMRLEQSKVPTASLEPTSLPTPHTSR